MSSGTSGPTASASSATTSPGGSSASAGASSSPGAAFSGARPGGPTAVPPVLPRDGANTSPLR
eukprot:1539196-Prorocentrum_lima.AAC.1